MSYYNQRSSYRDQRNPRNDRRNDNGNRGQYSSYKPSYSSNQPRQNYQQNHQQNYQQNSQRPPRQQNQDHLQVWMGDLDPNWSESDVLQIWKDQGLKPVSVKILRGEASNKAPYCFVNFSSTDEVNVAVERHGSTISGTNFRFKLKRAAERGQRAGQRQPTSSFGQFKGSQGDTYSSNDRFYENSGVERGFLDLLSLFVGDLASSVSEKDLFEEFNNRYPAQVKTVKVITDQSGRSKGYGFVKLQNAQVVRRALREMNGVLIQGKTIRIGSTKGIGSPSQTDTSARVGPPVVLSQIHPSISPFTDPKNTTISVKGLSGRFSRVEVENIFVSFGDIEKISILDDGNRAYVTFSVRSLAEMAILALHRVDIQGYMLEINWGKDNGFHKVVGPLYGEFNAYTSENQVGENRKGEKSEPVHISELNRQFVYARAREIAVFEY